MKLKSGIFSALLTAGILLSAFFIGGLFPFGNGTVSWCDMNQQAIPLLCDFKDILSGKQGFFLNFANGGGMNFYGVFFFFLASPFSFLAAFVNKADIPFLMNILVILKLSTAAFTAGVVFKSLFKDLSVGFSTVLGACYALCGYGMLFFQNIMWLDSMYLFPLVVLGLYKIIKGKSPLLLFLSLSGCIVVNYYISFMVFLFIIIAMGVFALFHPKSNRRIYFDLGFCGVFSLLSTAVVWVPSFLQYTASARRSSVIENLENTSFFAPTETTLPILLCSGIIFAVLLLFIPRFSSADKSSKFIFTLFLLTALPLVIEPINLMWHTGSYMSFPARYGFITVFMGLLLGAKELSRTEFAQKSKALPAIFSAILILLCGLFLWKFKNQNISTLSRYVQTLWGDEYSLKGLAIICLIVTILYFLVIFVGRRKILSQKTATLFLGLILVFESICSVGVYMESANGKLGLHNYQSFLALEEKAQKDGFYRVNTTHKLTDANMTGAAGFNTISHYTSLNSAEFMESAKQLGYSGYWMETGNWGGSIISDALLSVGYTVFDDGGEYILKENPYYLGLGIKTENPAPEKLSHRDRLLSLGEALAVMSGRENIVTKYESNSQRSCYVDEDENGYFITPSDNVSYLSYKIKVTNKQHLYFDCYNGFSNNLVEDINESFSVYVNGILIANEYPTQRQNGLLDLGSFKNETVNITLSVLKSAECCSFGVFGIDEEGLTDIIKTTKSLDLKTEKGRVNGTVEEKGTYFLSIPYDPNLKIELNGEKIEYNKALSGFVTFVANKSGDLEISYIPKGFTLSVAISLLGILAAGIYIKFSKRLKFINTALENIIFGIFFGVFTIAGFVVYIIPIIVNLSDFTF